MFSLVWFYGIFDEFRNTEPNQSRLNFVEVLNKIIHAVALYYSKFSRLWLSAQFIVLMDKIGLSKHCSLVAEYGYKRSIYHRMYIDYSFFLDS